MSEELKPCPFCGGEGQLFVARGTKFKPAVTCTACTADMMGFTAEQAIAAWNTRAPAPEMAEALGGTIKALELAVRAATASAGFTGAEMDEILAEHVALKPARAALAKARGR